MTFEQIMEQVKALPIGTDERAYRAMKLAKAAAKADGMHWKDWLRINMPEKVA